MDGVTVFGHPPECQVTLFDKIPRIMNVLIQFDVNVAYYVAFDVDNDVLPVWWMEVYPFCVYKSLLRAKIKLFVSHYCPNKNNVNVVKTTVICIVLIYWLIIVARNKGKMFRFFSYYRTVPLSQNLPLCQFKSPVLYKMVGGLDDLSYGQPSSVRSATRRYP